MSAPSAATHSRTHSAKSAGTLDRDLPRDHQWHDGEQGQQHAKLFLAMARPQSMHSPHLTKSRHTPSVHQTALRFRGGKRSQYCCLTICGDDRNNGSSKACSSSSSGQSPTSNGATELAADNSRAKPHVCKGELDDGSSRGWSAGNISPLLTCWGRSSHAGLLHG